VSALAGPVFFGLCVLVVAWVALGAWVLHWVAGRVSVPLGFAVLVGGILVWGGAGGLVLRDVIIPALAPVP
jgi:hypothetical protein